METEKLILVQKKINTERRKALNYLAFIKFLAMIMIIKWHLFFWNKKPIDFGARMCEILFVSSGFLVGYNYYKKNMPCDYETSFNYSYKHLRSFYPLELINIIYGYYNYKGKKYDLTEFVILFSNLLMLKSWSRYSKLISIFNGITWFLTDLLLCYFLTPVLLQGIKNIKKSVILFFIISFIRTAIEEIIYHGALNIFDTNFHRGPIIRLLEFYMGMLLTPMFFYFKYYIDKYKNKLLIKIIFTFIQIISPITIYLIMLKNNNILLRCYFVFIFCFFVFIISYDFGILSDLFAHKLCVKIMSCQMEMFLFQKTIYIIFHYKIIKKHFEYIFNNNQIQFLIKLFIIFICGFLYKILVKEKFAKFLDIVFLENKNKIKI